MCGINGFISFKNQIDVSNYYQSHLTSRHRGPDDEGFYVVTNESSDFYKGDDTIEYFNNLPHITNIQLAKVVLGQRRLSIIDLTNSGHQPVHSEDNNYVMVYNGEVFNYIELRKELEKFGYNFISSSDSEVVLKAYIQWGKDCFNKFNGMWALAIYDKLNNRLVFSRDRFGIKPLYYTIKDGILYFASEIKFIKSFVKKKFTININSVKQYINNSLLNFSEDTFWNDIIELEPAHFMVFQNGKKRIFKYWNCETSSEIKNGKFALDKFNELFEDSIKLRMRSDVEVGSLLSGGLDSTTIVCTLNKLGFIKENSFKSFSAVFDEEQFSEKKYIDDTIKQLNLKSYFVYPKAEELQSYLENLLIHIEEPFRSLSVLSQYRLYETIKKKTDIKVVLNGEGADEMFAGYNIHYYYLFIYLIAHLKFRRFSNELNLFKKNRNTNNKVVLKYLLFLIKKFKFDLFNFNKMLFSEFKLNALREYLRYDDRNSMAFGIETRVPFLDYRIVEFAMSLNDKMKINNFENKKILRDYARNLIPMSVYERKDKTGFISPQELWQRNELKILFDNVFDDISKNGLVGIENPRNIFVLYKDYQQQKNNYWNRVWRIFCYYHWFKLNNK
ncbi:MAG: asparagine synthase (glutamine-hydrolyzing) [Ignavibacteriales bacterium]|nr:asparagine synthase (glutamine-hydrolyzing) [Ignavibacteriales bacterium]